MLTTMQPATEDKLSSECVNSNATFSVNASDANDKNHSITLQSLAKYRHYRFKVAAVTNAGVGEYTQWIYARTLAGSKNITLIVWESLQLVSQTVFYQMVIIHAKKSVV